MSQSSPESVAFELVSKLKGMGVWGEKNMRDILDMYAECLDAVQGNRSYIPGRCIMEAADKAKLDAVAKQRQQQMASQTNAQIPPAQVRPTHAQQAQPQAAHPQAVQQVRPAS